MSGCGSSTTSTAATTYGGSFAYSNVGSDTPAVETLATDGGGTWGATYEPTPSVRDDEWSSAQDQYAAAAQQYGSATGGAEQVAAETAPVTHEDAQPASDTSQGYIWDNGFADMLAGALDFLGMPQVKQLIGWFDELDAIGGVRGARVNGLLQELQDTALAAINPLDGSGARERLGGIVTKLRNERTLDFFVRLASNPASNIPQSAINTLESHVIEGSTDLVSDAAFDHSEAMPKILAKQEYLDSLNEAMDDRGDEIKAALRSGVTRESLGEHFDGAVKVLALVGGHEGVHARQMGGDGDVNEAMNTAVDFYTKRLNSIDNSGISSADARDRAIEAAQMDLLRTYIAEVEYDAYAEQERIMAMNGVQPSNGQWLTRGVSRAEGIERITGMVANHLRENNLSLVGFANVEWTQEFGWKSPGLIEGWKSPGWKSPGWKSPGFFM